MMIMLACVGLSLLNQALLYRSTWLPPRRAGPPVDNSGGGGCIIV